MQKSKWLRNYERVARDAENEKWEKMFLHLLKVEGLDEPVPQFRFWPNRKWRVDFAYPDKKIAVEIEGGIWMKGGGGHSHPMWIEKDIEKYNHLALLGFRLLRFSPKELNNGQAMALLSQVLGQSEHEIFPEIT